MDPIPELRKALLQYFGGRTLTVADMYREHDDDSNRYMPKHYKEALLQLENEALITADPPTGGRPPGTFRDDVVVTFPKGG
jgi:hypothetical protein